MTNSSQETVQSQVLAHSQNWINNFNQGKADACIALYKADAVMRAKPMGTFVGIGAIAGIWKPFIASGAKDLKYHDVKLETLDDSTVILSASWSMNVGRCVLTTEKWMKQRDGNWLLEQDDFEVLEQFKII